MKEAIEIVGTVEDIFAHRVTLKTETGKTLVDFGPGADLADIEPGQEIGVRGERKPGELKARDIRTGSGAWTSVTAEEKHPKQDGKNKPTGKGDAGAPDDARVTALLDEAGYTDHAERSRKPKHVEVTASKDGKRHTVHVHADGVKKAEPVT